MQNAINPFLLFCVKRHFSIVAFVTFACLCVCGLYNLVASIFKVFPAQPLHTRDMHDELPPWAPAHKGKTMFLSCKQSIEKSVEYILNMFTFLPSGTYFLICKCLMHGENVLKDNISCFV